MELFLRTETKKAVVHMMCIHRLIMLLWWHGAWEVDLRFPAEFVVMESISVLRVILTSIQDLLK